jgi:glycerophosphoryl diester phosphodiesterase
VSGVAQHITRPKSCLTGILLPVRRSRQAGDYAYFDNGGFPIAFAHRGGSQSADLRFENTMRSFSAAVDLGYRYLETDVNATSDGVLVAFHDVTLRRVAGHPASISDLPYTEIANARVGGSEPIPRLDEVLSAWPDVFLNIDAKSAASVPLLAAAIHAHRAWDRVCVASFSAASLSRCRRLLTSRVATSFSAPGAATLRLVPGRRLRSALLRSGVVAQVPVRNRGIHVVTPEFVDRAHELGKHVHVWTIDDADEITRLLDLGVDGIFADRIDVLREVFMARGIWRG